MFTARHSLTTLSSSLKRLTLTPTSILRQPAQSGITPLRCRSWTSRPPSDVSHTSSFTNKSGHAYTRSFTSTTGKCEAGRELREGQPPSSGKQESTASTPGASSVLSEKADANREKLPSHSQSLRSEFSKRLQVVMDGLLVKAAVAGQRLNTYTGTDYTGIENIRRQILDLEQRVKHLHGTVAAAKDAYSAAHTAQISSQREVVTLLERKASWTPHDLDRYTALIRSEHLHDQGVTQARQKLGEAERELEEARTELEKKERRQYHEEQVWSDTIRRNSTWVTFGLMGLNILLLVANIGIVEPWRRRRLVREVKDALDQKTLVNQGQDKVADAVAVMQPLDTPQVTIMETSPEGPDSTQQPTSAVDPLGKCSAQPRVHDNFLPPASPDPEAMPDGLVNVPEAPDASCQDHASRFEEWRLHLFAILSNTWYRTREVYGQWWQSPLSHDTLVLRKVEITSIALEGAAAGLTALGFLVWLLRSS